MNTNHWQNIAQNDYPSQTNFSLQSNVTTSSYLITLTKKLCHLWTTIYCPIAKLQTHPLAHLQITHCTTDRLYHTPHKNHRNKHTLSLKPTPILYISSKTHFSPPKISGKFSRRLFNLHTHILARTHSRHKYNDNRVHKTYKIYIDNDPTVQKTVLVVVQLYTLSRSAHASLSLPSLDLTRERAASARRRGWCAV